MFATSKRGLARPNFPKKIQGGFTLIELLVVISIIGLLSSVVLTAVQGARIKADNTQRNQLIGEYVKALTLAYDKAGGVYPGTIGSLTFSCLGDYPVLGTYSATHPCWSGFIYENPTVLNILDDYIPGLPTPKTVVGATASLVGALYRCEISNCTKARITWRLQGVSSGQTCIKGATLTSTVTGAYAGTTVCTLLLQ